MKVLCVLAGLGAFALGPVGSLDRGSSPAPPLPNSDLAVKAATGSPPGVPESFSGFGTSRAASAALPAVPADCPESSPGSAASAGSDGRDPNDGGSSLDRRDGSPESPQWGGRVGGIDAAGNLRVGFRSDPRPWRTVAKNVRSFQLFDWRLAVLTNDGTLFQQEGPLDAPLTEIARGVCAYQLTLTRTGILGCDHVFSVREMGFPARAVASNVRSFQVDGDRAAVLGFDGVLWGQRGGEVRGFQELARNVTRFQLERDWIAFGQQAPEAGHKSLSTRLMAGTWEDGRGLEVAECAAEVMDFELEAQIDPGPGFRTLARLAVVAPDGSVSVAAGLAPPLKTLLVDRGPAEKVAWAAGRLAVHAGERLRIAEIERDGFTAGFTDVPGRTVAFHFSPEGALAVDRGVRGSVEFFEIASPDREESDSAAANDSGSALLLRAGQPQIEIAGTAFAAEPPADLKAVALASLRPRHLRRAIDGPPLEASRIGGASGLPSAASTSVRFGDDFPPLPPASAEVAPEFAAPRAGVEQPLARPLATSSSATAIPLYQLYLPGATDHFYTTSASERLAAQNWGFLDQGIAAWVEPSQASGTSPFWRFYMGGVRTDHFYTLSQAEFNLVVGYGFIYEGVEGYLYTYGAPGTVPLHRLSWWNGANGDGDHFYTTSDAAKSTMLSQGWGYDGIAGWVWPSGPGAAGDDATPVSTSVPGSVTAGSSFTASVTMRNTGGTTWTAGAFYRLGSQSPQDNVNWGTNRVMLPASVPPGSTVTFTFPARAPTTAGTYTFQWQMVHEMVAWFGARTTATTINVAAAANRLPTGTLDALSTQYFSVQGWAYDPDVPTQSIVVHFDIDGVPVADVITDQYRADVNNVFGITGNHGFTWYLTGAYRTGTHTLRAYAVDSTTGQRVELALSPKTYTIASATYSITGNTGVNGATVTAGAFSAVSDADGNFTLGNLPAATYTLKASKTGCLFYPATQTITVGPSRTRVFFSSPCRLNYIHGTTSFADQYIQSYRFASGTYRFTDTVVTPNNVYPCFASDDGRVTCRPNLPLWKARQTFGTCSSLLFKSVESTHVRPRVGEYLPYGTNNYYWCSNCQVFGPIDPCAPYRVCTYVDFTNYIRVTSPIGARGGAIGCASPYFQSYQSYWYGSGSQNVYEGEIRPDGWGLVPASVDLRKWQTLVPGQRRLFANEAELGISMLAGDGYWTSEPIRMAPPPLLGGSGGPHCLSGAEQCVDISSRSKASLVNGQWYITISGYMTADNIFQNTFDAGADLNALGQIAQNGGTSASVNSHVEAIIAWMTLNQAYNAILLGHSLGAMDALVIYQLGYGGGVVAYAVPGVVPDNALLETTSPAVDGPRPVIGYGGLNDSIANVPSTCNGSTNGCRIQLCGSTGRCQYFELNTGTGFITLDNPHDRCRYQQLADPTVTCW